MDDFITQFNGDSLDFDHTSGSQCVDLAKAWLDHLGYDASGTWGNAKDWDKNAGKQGLQWIANTPTGVPQKGDLIVWGNGTYGHIAVFVSGDANSFDSFDQNYPVGSVCKIVHHTYSNVKGWLRTKYQEGTMEKDAIQFPDSERVYFWAQTPDVAKAWYGNDWYKYVRVVEPKVVEKPVPYETIKEVIKYIDKIEYKDSPETLNQVSELRAMVESLTLDEEDKQVLGFWHKFISFIRGVK